MTYEQREIHRKKRVLEHAELWSAYRSHVAHFMNSGLTVAVQTNRDGRVDLQSIVVRIARIAAQDGR